MGWVEIMPRHAARFRARRWDEAASFLDWTGILVNRHRDRQVEQVVRDGLSYYLKKQFAVTWRERLRNAWDGFGWCSTAVREAATLQALRQAGIGCPEVVALGEDARQAFVLLCDEADMRDLRAILPRLNEGQQRHLARALGQELARLHDAGFDHPDLFAKHILVAEQPAWRFSILDWQRSRRRRNVPWRVRLRDLAVLDATLHHTLANDRLRLHCLRVYCEATKSKNVPPFARSARDIRAAAALLLRRRGMREIAQPTSISTDQQFVSFDEGQLLVVRSYRDELAGCLPSWLDDLTSLPPRDAFIAGTSSATIIHLQWSRAKFGVLPPLAHTLFRLQRFGIAAPRLLAVGWSDTHVVSAVNVPTLKPIDQALAAASCAERPHLLRSIGLLIRRLNDAGYGLSDGCSWSDCLGVTAAGEVALGHIDSLVRERQPTLAETSFEAIALSESEQLCFLHGYLHEPSDPDARDWLQSNARSERQVVS